MKYIIKLYIWASICSMSITAKRAVHTTTALCKKRAGRHRPTLKGDKLLTYEMACRPHEIAHSKTWNSWNTSNLICGTRPADTAVEDIFIRKFMRGTWHNVFASEIIVKRQHNIIRIAGVITRGISPRKMYFLIGYTEEILMYWLQCPVKLEFQTVDDKKDVAYKYI